MVRSTIAFAVVALGAAAVIAQVPDLSELEARDYETFDSRGLEDVVEFDARDAGGQNPMPMNSSPSYQPPVAAVPAPTPVGVDHAAVPAPTPAAAVHAGGDSPSRTVTITHTPTPTPCTKRQAKRQTQMTQIEEAVAIVRAASKQKDPLTPEEKDLVKKAKKYLKTVRQKRAKRAKRTIKKCKAALKKAGLTVKDCKAGADCESAYLADDLTIAHCKTAFKYVKRMKAAKKAEKKAKNRKGGKKDSHKKDSHKTDSDTSEKSKKSKKSNSKKANSKKAKPYSDLLPPTKTTKEVGADGITTVIVNAGPICTATPGSELKSSKSSKSSKRLVARDEDFEFVFAREFEFDNLD